jgi:hypothetical protein
VLATLPLPALAHREVCCTYHELCMFQPGLYLPYEIQEAAGCVHIHICQSDAAERRRRLHVYISMQPHGHRGASMSPASPGTETAAPQVQAAGCGPCARMVGTSTCTHQLTACRPCRACTVKRGGGKCRSLAYASAAVSVWTVCSDVQLMHYHHEQEVIHRLHGNLATR